MMPAQKPHRSEQVVCTPRELLIAVAKRFGPIQCDLACTRDNAVVPHCYAIEDGSSLAREWPSARAGLCWLNPPFGDVEPWARKCAEGETNVAMLVPASVGTRWYADYVHGRAFVLALSPRVQFVGHGASFPKDLLLCVYGAGLHGFDLWQWKPRRGEA